MNQKFVIKINQANNVCYFVRFDDTYHAILTNPNPQCAAVYTSFKDAKGDLVKLKQQGILFASIISV